MSLAAKFHIAIDNYALILSTKHPKSMSSPWSNNFPVATPQRAAKPELIPTIYTHTLWTNFYPPTPSFIHAQETFHATVQFSTCDLRVLKRENPEAVLFYPRNNQKVSYMFVFQLGPHEFQQVRHKLIFPSSEPFLLPGKVFPWQQTLGQARK